VTDQIGIQGVVEEKWHLDRVETGPPDVGGGDLVGFRNRLQFAGPGVRAAQGGERETHDE
jgi:hypothetical protein